MNARKQADSQIQTKKHGYSAKCYLLGYMKDTYKKEEDEIEFGFHLCSLSPYSIRTGAVPLMCM